jgi:hypothetical protein
MLQLRFYESGIHDGKRMVVLEYTGGCDLWAFVKSAGYYPVKNVRRWVR